MTGDMEIGARMYMRAPIDRHGHVYRLVRFAQRFCERRTPRSYSLIT